MFVKQDYQECIFFRKNVDNFVKFFSTIKEKERAYCSLILISLLQGKETTISLVKKFKRYKLDKKLAEQLNLKSASILQHRSKLHPFLDWMVEKGLLIKEGGKPKYFSLSLDLPFFARFYARHIDSRDIEFAKDEIRQKICNGLIEKEKKELKETIKIMNLFLSNTSFLDQIKVFDSSTFLDHTADMFNNLSDFQSHLRNYFEYKNRIKGKNKKRKNKKRKGKEKGAFGEFESDEEKYEEYKNKLDESMGDNFFKKVAKRDENLFSLYEKFKPMERKDIGGEAYSDIKIDSEIISETCVFVGGIIRQNTYKKSIKPNVQNKEDRNKRIIEAVKIKPITKVATEFGLSGKQISRIVKSCSV